MAYKIIKFKEFKPNSWISPLGATFISLYITSFLAIIIFLINEIPNIEEKHKFFLQNYSELRVDSIKKGKTSFIINYDDDLASVPEITFWFKLKNNSNLPCYIIFMTTIDTLSIDDNLRKRIKNRNMANVEFIRDTSFRQIVLYPNESKWFEKTASLSPLNNYQNEYIHCEVIYSNTMGGLYDTYFIQELKYNLDLSKPIPKKVDTLETRDTLQINVIYMHSDIYEFTNNLQILPPYCFTIPEMEYIKEISKQNLPQP